MVTSSGVSRKIFRNTNPNQEIYPMKIVIRAFVVVLALTGAAASTYTSSASAKTIAASVQSHAMPIPTCDPNGTSNCGIK